MRLVLLSVVVALGCVELAPDESDSGTPAVGKRVGVIDQGETPPDLGITRRIRRAVMADDALSFSAKNAKIITRDGRVTLQGSLKSNAERRVLLTAAHSVAGEGRVVDQLRVED